MASFSHLRAVADSDLALFFDQQQEPEATQMAAFPARDRPTFMAHWAKILADPLCITQTIVADDEVAGNIGSWLQDGERDVGYWLGRAYWGQGIATQALTAFLAQLPERPLYAYVVRHNIGSRRVLEKCGFTVCAADPQATHAGADDVEEIRLILT
ncbi:MAG: GNAT family N-acetyltransferase [Chloroflexota bacterium]|nr:GNAT family N-acetyltransferase [Chloroflexota bacterium]